MKIVHILYVIFVALINSTPIAADPLHQWAKLGNLKSIKHYERLQANNKKTINWDSKDDLSQTLLMLAAMAGHDQIVIYLLEHNVDPSIRDNTGKTAFDYANKANGELIKAALIKRSLTKDGQTLLTQTIKIGDTKHFNDLIGYKDTDINQPNATGKTPLHIAVLEDKQDMVNRLLALCTVKIDAQDKEGNTPLHYAAQLGNLPLVMALTGAGALATISNAKKQLPKDMIKMNKTIDPEEFKAIQKQLQEIELSPINIKKAKQNCIAIPATAASCPPNSPDVKCKEEARKKHADRVKQQERAALEQYDEEGYTLLTRAACQGDPENVSKILDLGALINAPDESGNTALIAAIKCYTGPVNEYKHLKVITLLLKKGASLHFHDLYRKYPLHYAVEHENKPAVQTLLGSLSGNKEKNDIINAQDGNLDTALHYAVAVSNYDLIKMLLHHGASRDIPNKAGKFARDLLGTKQSTSPETLKNLKEDNPKIRKLLGLEVEGVSGSGTAAASAAAKPNTKPNTRTASQLPAVQESDDDHFAHLRAQVIANKTATAQTQKTKPNYKPVARAATQMPATTEAEAHDEWNATRMGRSRTESVFEDPIAKK